jgi:hypothetical protein
MLVSSALDATQRFSRQPRRGVACSVFNPERVAT